MRRFQTPLTATALTAALALTSFAASIPVASASSDDHLTVAAGRIGDLKMGSTTRLAKKKGWIARDKVCGGWTAGQKALKSTSSREVFKALPDKIENGRVLSMWAIGRVQTTRGIRTRSLDYPSRPGSSLASIRREYPDLRQLGSRVDVSGLRNTIFTSGSRSKGWLDFHVYTKTKRLNFVIVRSDGVDWQFEGASGC